MWTSARRSGATQPRRSRALAGLILLACVGLAACTAAQSATPASPSESENPPSAAETLPPLPENTGDEVIDPGTYLVSGFTVPFEITVPEGWQSFGWGVLKTLDDEWKVFVNFLPPTSVPADGCQWSGTFVDVADPRSYVDAMAGQTGSHTSEPVEITMGDYSGFEFDYSVEDDVDFAECDHERLCLYADSGSPVCTRTFERHEERETERAIDLNGELAIFAVGQFRDVDPALTAEARAVFDSIRFRSPEE